MHSSDSSQEIVASPTIPAPAPSRQKSNGGSHLRRCALLIACTLVALASPSFSPCAQQTAATSPLAVPARTWASDCANNEILVIKHPESYLRYRFHVVDEKGDQVRDQIETPEGSVARLIQHDGRPLTPEEDSAERERLNDLLNSPSSFFHHIRREQDNKKMGVQLLLLMQDAMLWSYTPGQPLPPDEAVGHSTAPSPTDPPLVVLDFKPNPQWSPPDMESEPLTGLEGRVWIDPRTRRMVLLEGSVFRGVNMGWGMVAHLYPGGTVTLHQISVPTSSGVQRFIVNHIDEQLTIRALMIKTVKQRLVFDTANFQPVPSMSYQQAIKILLDTPLPTH